MSVLTLLRDMQCGVVQCTLRLCPYKPLYHVSSQCVNFDAKTIVFLGYVFSENDPFYVQNNFIQPPINPTPRPYLRVMWIHTLLYLGHMGGGNRCGGIP